MERWLLSFLFGALLALCFTQIVDTYYLVSLTLSCLCVLFFSFKYKSLIYIFAVLVGLTYVMAFAYKQQQWSSNEAINIDTLHQSSQYVEGEITSLINPSNQDIRFNLRVSTVNKQLLTYPFLIRLTLDQSVVNQNSKSALTLEQGNVVALLVNIKPAHGLANIGSFSYQKWLHQQHIVATGYVKHSSRNQVLIPQTTLRQRLQQQINDQIKHPLTPILLALAIGDKSQIDDQQWQTLQTTGTQHLMAISGLHLGLIASLGFLIAKGLLWLCPPLFLSQRLLFYIPMLSSLTLAAFYAQLAGFSIPTIRALVMLLCFYGLRVFQQKVKLLRWLSMSAFGIVIIEPLALIDSSFYLSFSAVAIILFSFWRYQYLLSTTIKWLRIGQSWLLIQGAISLLLFPLTLLLFKQVSVLAGITNLLVVPWMSITAIPLTLISTLVFIQWPWLGEWLYRGSLFCIELAFEVLEFFNAINWNLINYSTLAIVISVLGATFAVIISFRIYKPWQLCLAMTTVVITILLTDFSYRRFQNQQNIWYLTIFDVGHGLAVLIEKQGKALLYDTGASFKTGYNFVESTIIPYMQQYRLTTLDTVYISHQDNDHAGGLSELIKNNYAKSYVFNFKLNEKLKTLAPTDIKIGQCFYGQKTNWQGLTITPLWPNKIVEHKGKTLKKPKSRNDNSCVLEISDSSHTVLLPGDISEVVESLLVKEKRLTNVDILIAPHHGSKSSSSLAFINAVMPHYVIYSSGFLNRWKMPVTNVQYRYSLSNANQINTGEVGMVQFTLTENSISMKTYRQHLRPFWPWR